MNYSKTFSIFTGTIILFFLIYAFLMIESVFAKDKILKTTSHNLLSVIPAPEKNFQNAGYRTGINSKSIPKLNRSLFKLDQQEFRRSKAIMMTERENSDTFRGARPKNILLNISESKLNANKQIYQTEHLIAGLKSMENLSRKFNCNNINSTNTKIIACANNLKTKIIIT